MLGSMENHHASFSKGVFSMKNILVLGATGGIGRLVVQQLNQLEYVKQAVYVRNASKLKPEDVAVATVLEGDVLDTEKLTEAMQGQEVVIAALAGDLPGQAKSIVKAMKQTKVTRVIWVTGLGIHHEVPGAVGEMLNYYVSRFPEYVQAADTIANSGIAYTLVRAANLTDGGNMEYFLSKEGENIHSESVTRSAVAKFIVDMIKDENNLGENDSLGITN
jgi:Putative NADH-flavin reductase